MGATAYQALQSSATTRATSRLASSTGAPVSARILLSDPHRALVIGPSRLHGATIVSPDIRAGMALIAAALAAPGRSVIRNVQQVDRGYERIDARLKALGARITRE